MPGQIKRMLDQIVEKRARGNALVAELTVTKLMLKGLNPEKYNASSPDDPAVISRARTVAAELGVSI